MELAKPKPDEKLVSNKKSRILTQHSVSGASSIEITLSKSIVPSGAPLVPFGKTFPQATISLVDTYPFLVKIIMTQINGIT